MSRWIGVCAVAFAVGCSAATEPTEVLGRAASPIVMGTASTSDQDAVVLLVLHKDGKPYGTCTGTLVAPKLVLTARHCVSEKEAGGVSCASDGRALTTGAVVKADRDPRDFYVYTGTGAIRSAEDTGRAAARGTELVHEGAESTCDTDVAFLVLDRSIQGRIAPLRLKDGVAAGEVLTSIGWGRTELATLPETRLQRTGVAVTAVGPLVGNPTTGAGYGASELVVDEANCFGDSGGPSFSSKGAVVGIVSRGGGGTPDPANPVASCIGPNAFTVLTHLSEKTALVTKAFAAAGAQPRVEGDATARAVGEACNVHFDCSSSACIDGRCFQRCDDGTTCAANDYCKAHQTKNVCWPSPKNPGDEADPGKPEADATAGTATPPSTTAGTATDAPLHASADASASESGCTAAPGRHGGHGSSAGGLVIALGAVAVATRRRRRRA